MKAIREKTQTVIREFDDEVSFVILLAAALLPYLEKPVNRARFFNYDKELELYFSPKDLNRFTRLQKLFEYIGEMIDAEKLSGFTRTLKSMREHKIMLREKEGPSEGMAWQGFGGVHSHYTLTPIGLAVLIFQTSLRCSAVNLKKIPFSEDWDQIVQEEVDLIISTLVANHLKIRDHEKHFYTKREEASFISQRVFEVIASSKKSVTKEELRSFIEEHAGEVHIGEIPGALQRLSPLLHTSGSAYRLNTRGEAVMIGYANVLVEVAISFEELELVHHMISAKSIEAGARDIIANFAYWF